VGALLGLAQGLAAHKASALHHTTDRLERQDCRRAEEPPGLLASLVAGQARC
jgi:hypothetical protein